MFRNYSIANFQKVSSMLIAKWSLFDFFLNQKHLHILFWQGRSSIWAFFSKTSTLVKILNQQKALKNDGLLFKKVSNARLDKGLPLNANFSS